MNRPYNSSTTQCNNKEDTSNNNTNYKYIILKLQLLTINMYTVYIVI